MWHVRLYSPITKQLISTCETNVQIKNPKEAFELSNKWEKDIKPSHEEMGGKF